MVSLQKEASQNKHDTTQNNMTDWLLVTNTLQATLAFVFLELFAVNDN